MPSQFDKDFGYLIPFLDRVGQAAQSLGDPRARDELRQLLVGEKQKWERIRALLGGAAGGAQPARKDVEVSAAAAPQNGTSGPSFTVGALKRAPR